MLKYPPAQRPTALEFLRRAVQKQQLQSRQQQVILQSICAMICHRNPKTSVKYYENGQNLYRKVTDVIIQIIRYENTKTGYYVQVALILIVKISVKRQRLEQLNSLSLLIKTY